MNKAQLYDLNVSLQSESQSP